MTPVLLKWGHSRHPECRKYSPTKLVTRCQESLHAILILMVALLDKLNLRPTAMKLFAGAI